MLIIICFQDNFFISVFNGNKKSGFISYIIFDKLSNPVTLIFVFYTSLQQSREFVRNDIICDPHEFSIIRIEYIQCIAILFERRFVVVSKTFPVNFFGA